MLSAGFPDEWTLISSPIAIHVRASDVKHDRTSSRRYAPLSGSLLNLLSRSEPSRQCLILVLWSDADDHLRLHPTGI